MNCTLSNILAILILLLYGCSSSNDGMEEIIDCANSSLALIVVSKKASICGENTGRIEIKGEGGREPYLYSLNGGPRRNSGVFEDLPTGEQFLKVWDELECEAEEVVLLDSGVSLSNDVFERIGATCAISGCHVAGAQSPNFTIKSNIRSASQNIKRRLEENSMPPPDSGKDPMSDADKAMVICWINDGAMDN